MANNISVDKTISVEGPGTYVYTITIAGHYIVNASANIPPGAGIDLFFVQTGSGSAAATTTLAHTGQIHQELEHAFICAPGDTLTVTISDGELLNSVKTTINVYRRY